MEELVIKIDKIENKTQSNHRLNIIGRIASFRSDQSKIIRYQQQPHAN
jgi:hypothetical protein